MNDERTLRKAIAEVGKLLYERKLLIATDGNISVRLDRRQILITPAGFCKGFLSPEDIVRMPLASKLSSRTPDPRPLTPSPAPSSEHPLHLAVYQARPDVCAIIHAHPPYATSFAASRRKLDAGLLPETRLFDGPVGRVGYIEPGSERLARAVARKLRKHSFCLLVRHGAVSTGRNLLEAYYRLERLEFLAQVTAVGGMLRDEGR